MPLSTVEKRALQVSWWAAPWRPPDRALIPGLALAAVVVTVVQGLLPGIIGIVLALCLLIAIWAFLFRKASGLLLIRLGSIEGTEFSELDVPQGVGARHVILWVLVMLLLLAWQAGGNTGLMIVGGALLALMLPAATLVLSRVGSLAEALYPPAWKAVIDKMGRGRYLAACAWLLALAGVYLLLDRLFSSGPDWLRNAVLMAWWAYAMLAWFALLGQTVATPRSGPRKPPPRSPQAVDVEALFERLLQHGGSNEEHRRLFNALLQQQDQERLEKFARRWLPALLEGFDRPHEAVERCDQLLAEVPIFSLETPSGMLALIKASEKHGYPDLTARLCRNFLTHFPVAPKRETVKAILSRIA